MLSSMLKHATAPFVEGDALMYSLDLSPYPEGWYCLGFSSELAPGAVLARRIAGQEVVLFRGQNGIATALDAYCPHLGAHFAHGGRVEENCLRCPFHAFHFDQTGQCVRTEYGTKPPPKAKARRWPLIERMGVMFIFVGAEGTSPPWELPEVSTEGWTAWRWHQWQMRGHVQEIAENSVDIGHFTHIHKYEAVKTISPLKTQGFYLNARYGMRRPAGLFSQTDGIETEFEIHQYGLGLARVEVVVTNMGLKTRQLVLATPLDEEQICLRIAFSVQVPERSTQLHPLLAVVPRTWQAELVAHSGIRAFVEDVSQDIPIWQNKQFMRRPALADGDGPVGAYRRWARQFYGKEAAAQAAALEPSP